MSYIPLINPSVFAKFEVDLAIVWGAHLVSSRSSQEELDNHDKPRDFT